MYKIQNMSQEEWRQVLIPMTNCLVRVQTKEADHAGLQLTVRVFWH